MPMIFKGCSKVYNCTDSPPLERTRDDDVLNESQRVADYFSHSSSSKCVVAIQVCNFKPKNGHVQNEQPIHTLGPSKVISS